MSPRIRKAIGGVAILAFPTAYVVAAVTIAAHLPPNRLIQLVYFAVAGIAWGLPLVPLMSWMERGGPKP